MSGSVKKNKYTCEACGIKFVSEWSNEEAEKEAESMWGKGIMKKNPALVCENCYQRLMSRLN